MMQHPSSSGCNNSNNNNNGNNNAGTMLGLFASNPSPSGHLMPAPQGPPTLTSSPGFLMPMSSTMTQLLPQPSATPISQLSLAEMESIISPLTRRRSDGFAKEEVKLMIREIERRRHVLLSVSPSHNKLKRLAWEEVANCMAEKFPHENRRTGDQVKKKWENIVSKTKKKIRDGHVTPELDWNETNTLVMQFLASATQEMRVRQQNSLYGCPPSSAALLGAVDQSQQAYSTASSLGYGITPNCAVSSIAIFPSTLTSHIPGPTMVNFPDEKSSNHLQQHLSDPRDGKPTTGQHDDVSVCKPEDTNCNRAVDTTGDTAVASISTNDDIDDDDNDDDSDAENDSRSHVGFSARMSGLRMPTNSALLPPAPNDSLLLNSLNMATQRPIVEELMRNAREEHQLRMEVLQLQKRVWQIKKEALERKHALKQATLSLQGEEIVRNGNSSSKT